MQKSIGNHRGLKGVLSALTLLVGIALITACSGNQAAKFEDDQLNQSRIKEGSWVLSEKSCVKEETTVVDEITTKEYSEVSILTDRQDIDLAIVGNTILIKDTLETSPGDFCERDWTIEVSEQGVSSEYENQDYLRFSAELKDVSCHETCTDEAKNFCDSVKSEELSLYILQKGARVSIVQKDSTEQERLCGSEDFKLEFVSF